MLLARFPSEFNPNFRKYKWKKVLMNVCFHSPALCEFLELVHRHCHLRRGGCSKGVPLKPPKTIWKIGKLGINALICFGISCITWPGKTILIITLCLVHHVAEDPSCSCYFSVCLTLLVCDIILLCAIKLSKVDLSTHCNVPSRKARNPGRTCMRIIDSQGGH